jgi:hypothetical protein
MVYIVGELMDQDKKTDKKIEEQIREELDINQADIIRELTNQPAKFFYWGALWAAACRAKRKQRLARQVVEAEYTNSFRAQMAVDKPTERVTENMIKNYLNGHPDIQEAEAELIKKEYIEEMLSVAKDAMKERHQALLEIVRRINEEAFYGGEYAAMRKELEAQETVKAKRKVRKPEPITENIGE